MYKCGSESDHDDEAVGKFYEYFFSKAIDKKSCRYHFLMGHFSVRLGARSVNDNMSSVGPFGIGNINERGERLLNFAEQNNN